MNRVHTTTVTIPQSGSISGDLAIIGGVKPGLLWSPVVTSCQIYMRGSFDTTSANFVPIDKTDGSTRWAWNVGPGSAAVGLESFVSFPYMRIETSVTQANTAVFTVGVKL